MVRLTEWPLFQPAMVTAVNGGEGLVRRLAEQGIHVGGVLEILGVAPFRGPLLVRTKGAIVAMRQGEATCVMVQSSNP